MKILLPNHLQFRRQILWCTLLRCLVATFSTATSSLRCTLFYKYSKIKNGNSVTCITFFFYLISLHPFELLCATTLAVGLCCCCCPDTKDNNPCLASEVLNKQKKKAMVSWQKVGRDKKTTVVTNKTVTVLVN